VYCAPLCGDSSPALSKIADQHCLPDFRNLLSAAPSVQRNQEGIMIYYIIDRRFPSAFRRSVELGTRTGTDQLMDFEFPYLYHFVYPGQSIRTIVADTGRYIAQAKWVKPDGTSWILMASVGSGWLYIRENKGVKKWTDI
jgi:hypothetical protein